MKAERPRAKIATIATGARPRGSLQRMVRRRWMTYRHTAEDRDGLWLVKLRGGGIHLGTFYCGSFVMDGYNYNETPGMIGKITHLQLVEPPNSY